MIRLFWGLLFSLLSVSAPSLAPGTASGLAQSQAQPSPVLKAMDLELGRSIDALRQADPPAYFVSYTVTDQTSVTVEGSNGALLESDQQHNRVLETQNHVAPAVGNGTITGTVLDELLHPVPHAMVYAELTGVAMGMAVPWAYSDANGRFAIHQLPWGTYLVEAGKPSAGYPPAFTFTNFYGHRRVPSVTVSPQAPAATVVVRMLRAGILSGRIVDARTGQPITKADYTLRREGRAGAQTSGAMRAHFTLPIPAEMAIILTVQARGFAPWRETVKIAPGERKVLTIRLRPLAPEPGTP
jgi:hypothetical protein